MAVVRQIMQNSKPVKFSRQPGTGSQQYSREGGVSLMLPVKVASKSLYETSAVSLFTRLPTPMLLVARSIAAPKSRWQSRSHAYLFSVLSHGFSRKRETARSLPNQQTTENLQVKLVNKLNVY